MPRWRISGYENWFLFVIYSYFLSPLNDLSPTLGTGVYRTVYIHVLSVRACYLWINPTFSTPPFVSTQSEVRDLGQSSLSEKGVWSCGMIDGV